MLQVKLQVKGLDCAEEIQLIKKVLDREKGIHDLKFNILEEQVEVFYDPAFISVEQIMHCIRKTGLKAKIWTSHTSPHESFFSKHGHFLLTCLSAFFLFLGVAISYFSPPFPSLWNIFLRKEDLLWQAKLSYFLSILSALILFFPKILSSLKRVSPDMHLLMVIAITGAMLINEWFEGASVAFLFSLALLLEKWSVERARRAIFSLLGLSPKKAVVIDPTTNTGKEIEIENVAIGSTIMVRPGEKIPLDGIVSKGNSHVDQSPITGESLPVLKKEGDEVFAGTLNKEGSFTFLTTKKEDQTILSKMIRLVEEARSKRSESETWVETFAKYYTPIMLFFSLLVMVTFPLFLGAPWEVWIYRGLVLLVIACPCALVISTPVSIVSGLTAAARRGVLIKGGAFLEEIGKLKAFAVDKTGTLTYGHPEVQRIIPLNQHTEKELMERAYALERASEHPLARAILRKAEEMDLDYEEVSQFKVVLGKGALATYRNKLYWIGSHRFMHEMQQETEEVHDLALQLEDAGHSVVAIGTEDHVCGLISVADSPRESIREIIEEMKKEGIQYVIMLTGDNEPTANALAALSGVDHYRSELLPEEKLEIVQSLKERWEKVGMIGDGINDAAAMAAATVSFAMAGMGTDAAIEIADVSLMGDDIAKLPWIIRYSRKVLRIIKENISFSLSVKAIFIALALLNLATLWMAIAADTGATLIVIFNALRLLKSKV